MIRSFLRLLTTNSGPAAEGERRLYDILTKKFPKAKLAVEDISGGCGSMYQIFVESNIFKGKSIVEQHKLVQDTLKEEIKSMHGIRITTKVAKD